ncbi:hypothetical protein H5410_037573 [Solanum commersonii]|uniref:DUF4283 domain-containing protein n=1 Tax=Solanum commersonii TaxID=4109 RepID=A0A9J5Y880_SOLCO|nr:hypothetical protein H5410_037573 [Solanum commersonii]
METILGYETPLCGSDYEELGEVGDSPTIAFGERYIVLQVNIVSKPKVYYHDDEYFLVRFAKVDDMNEVWSPKFDFNKEVLQIVPIYVKYSNLPLDCWSMDLGLVVALGFLCM